MTTVLPPEVTYGTVTGKFIQAVADSGDADSYPDSVPAQGSITFTPQPALSQSRGKGILSPSSTTPVTIIPQPITVDVGSDGSFSVVLIATDDANLNPTGWTYLVSFNFYGVKYGAFNIAVPGGQTTDLTLVTPVSESAGTPIIQGPKGDPGDFDGHEVLVDLGSVTGMLTIDSSTGTAFSMTLVGNTVVTITGAVAGEVTYVTLRVKQDATGGRTLTVQNGQYAQGAAPILSASAGAVDKLICETWDSGAHWDVGVSMQAIA